MTTSKQNIIDIAKVAGGILLISQDEVRKERLINSLANTFFSNNTSDELSSPYELERHNAAEWNLKTFHSFEDSLQNFSLFAEKRCILIKNIDKLNTTLTEQFLKIFEPDLTDICIIIPVAKILKTSKLYKKFSGLKRIIELEPLTPAQTQKWIQHEFTTLGIKQASSALINLITTQAQASLDTAVSLVEKLALYANSDTLEEKDFYAVFQEVPEPKEFDLIDALQQKRIFDAEVLLKQLLNSGKNQFLLLTMIYKAFLQSFLIRLALDKGQSQINIQEQLNIKSAWVFKKYLAVAQCYSAWQLRQKLALILRTDSKLKNKSLSVDCTLGELLKHLA